ncbi:MAG: nuclear transport factor 2 family protein [Pseudomonadota bacterium]
MKKLPPRTTRYACGAGHEARGQHGDEPEVFYNYLALFMQRRIIAAWLFQLKATWVGLAAARTRYACARYGGAMQEIQVIATRLAVEDAVVRLFVATDERDWAALEACFTTPFTLDMTSMAGGSPAQISPREVATASATAFQPLDHVHHQIGNLQTTIDGSAALVRCYGVAFHHRAAVTQGLKTRTFVGTYELKLRRDSSQWLVTELKYLLKFIDGNPNLENSR